MKKAIFVFVSIALLLTGCSSVPKEYGSVDDLLSAFIGAGGTCSVFTQDNAEVGAVESGDCDSGTKLAIYADATSAMTAATELADSLKELGMFASVAYGGNWVIWSPQIFDVAESLGGTVLNN